ncbi:CRACD-like protein [Rhinophrynus dorsalis]
MDTKLREGETLVDDGSAKKKSKFKSFKKFFGKKKRKETVSSIGKSGLKQSQSASDVTVPDSMRVDYDSEDEVGSTASVLGSRAVSHDSIFIPDIVQETARPVRVFSQENVSDRIKALQLKIQSSIRPGFSPFGILTKRTEDTGTSSEDDGLPRSPPEMSLIHEALKSKFSDRHHSSLSLGGTGSEEDEQISSGHSSRPLSPEQKQLKNTRRESPQRPDSSNISPSADFDTPAQFSTFLDNSAAKHRLSIKPRNQRSCKNRRPSAALQEESSVDLTCTEEEDEGDMKDTVTTSTSDHWDQKVTEVMTAGISATHNTWEPDLSNVVPQSQEEQENDMSSTIIMGGESQCIGEVVQIQSSEKEPLSALTSPPEEKMTAPDTKLEERANLQNELVENSRGDINESGDSNLRIIERDLFDLVLGNSISSKKDESSVSLLSSPEKSIHKDNRMPVEPRQSMVSDKPYVANDLVPATNSAHVGHSPKSSSQQPSSVELLLARSNKSRCSPEQPLSDKENNKQVGNADKKGEKPAGETGAQRKFSVSSAWERPRTGSFTLKANSDVETLKPKKLSLPKPGTSVCERVKDEPRPAATHTENKAGGRKKETLADSEFTSSDKAAIGHITIPQGSVPAARDLPAVIDIQTDPEDKNPFFVKLRSTSLSLRYRDGINPEASRLKRHSAEFKQERAGCLPFSKEELIEIKNTEINALSKKTEKLKSKTNPTEPTPLKPPLPKKPVLQNITVADNNTNKESATCVSNQEKAQTPECRSEHKSSERRQSFHKTSEKGNASPVTAAEPVKGTESRSQPTWISMARQRHRGLKDEQLPPEDKPVSQEAEKQSKEKERGEVVLKQNVDLVQSKTTNVASQSESLGQDNNAVVKEPRQRANTLSLPIHAPQSSTLVEKEEKTTLRRATQSISEQPSWMELAKKKSQAWSDMPQIIK